MACLLLVTLLPAVLNSPDYYEVSPGRIFAWVLSIFVSYIFNNFTKLCLGVDCSELIFLHMQYTFSVYNFKSFFSHWDSFLEIVFLGNSLEIQ